MAPPKDVRYSMNTYPICDSPLKRSIGAVQLLFVTEIAPPQPFFACKQKPYPVTFLGGAKTIRYSVNIALTCLMPFADVTLFKTGLKGLLTKFRSIK